MATIDIASCRWTSSSTISSTPHNHATELGFNNKTIHTKIQQMGHLNWLEDISRYVSKNGQGTMTDHVKAQPSIISGASWTTFDAESQQHEGICRGSSMDLQFLQ
eukprot:3809184-Amphidinium_carterae.1